jgi:signal transduction histidine kinase
MLTILKEMISRNGLRFLSAMDKRAKDSDAQMIAFGIFGIINYPLFYFVWSTISQQPYENVGLRSLAGFLSLGLLLKKYWPQKLQAYLPIYWYLTLLFCLPFFCTFMFLKNQGSEGWVLNGMLVLFLLILIVDWVSFAWLLTVGIITGSVYYLFLFGKISIINDDLFGPFSSYIVAIIIGMVFSRNRENLRLKEKVNSITTLSASIAHELRTPLASINNGASGVKEYLPSLINAYNAAKDANILVEPIPPLQLNDLNNLLEDVIAEAKFSNTVVDMLLIKVRQPDIAQKDFMLCSMKEIINETLRRYPFDIDELALVIWDNDADFTFKGNELFMTHIFFNLLKNALYHIKAARKGNVHIWLELGDKMNKLYFKDTGTGIPAKYMPHLFTQFFTKSHRGTGLGLTFCKLVMESFGGSIICRSIEGEYTEFVLSFPVVSDVMIEKH